MFKRRHFNQTTSFKDRLATFARLMRERAELMPPGDEKDAMLRKANEAETASEIDQWFRSSELKPPE
mgnify:CR=1 FL=1